MMAGATQPRRFSGTFTVPIMALAWAFATRATTTFRSSSCRIRGDLSMVVVLPDGVNDLPAVEREVALNYTLWLAALRPANVDLWLPRWTTNSRLDLGAALQDAGMRLALTRAADLSGMSDVPLFIGKVVQEAFIDVTRSALRPPRGRRPE
jgi:serine protease inhibitor